MTDIAERLATARDMIELERAAADAIDEIERLRIELAESERVGGEFMEEIERLRKAARYAHAAIKTYHAMYPHRATGALLDAAGRLWEVLGND